VHGGPDKAIYAYDLEHTEQREAELDRPLGPEAFGERLTVSGHPVSGAVIGEQWAIGTALLEVWPRWQRPVRSKRLTLGSRTSACERTARPSRPHRRLSRIA
jgi:MOSC domain